MTIVISKPYLQLISYLVMWWFLIAIIPLHLFPCFIAGFLAYEVIISLTPWFERIVGIGSARLFVVAIITIFLVIIMTLGIIRILNFITNDIQSSIDILAEINSIFANIQNRIPDCLSTIFLPKSTEDLHHKMISLIESNLVNIHTISSSILHTMITIFIGIILGILISLHQSSNSSTYFIHQLVMRLRYFSKAFRNIVFAQIKVSLVNTVLTSIILLMILPILGLKLPLGKTLIILTFIFGLLPMIGNLISNFMIIISAFSVSLTVGGFMMIYLIFIHKLEYFINAEIVGNSIQAKAWELLLAMLISEAAFGIDGLIAAPIYYAYLKNELRAQELI
ncbi:AI-2E family transporter [Candidatus Palibaumannia cicadellinicola]|uniref:Membrane protein, putative n=1 Tax=Candidatus Palibaumannia cicadellinicola TaxID=186490 RepID=A0A0K2BJY0_9GAMM|nr:AI-2E family transporter [Candidatus Baumannia cicadellinicola]AKZ65726.1 membrane protein, putative [Candidatus Baumannia cicadellinicola]